jgi:hypothetical protein
MKLIKTLSKTNKGLTRNELINQSRLPSGGDFSIKLEELIESGFVTDYPYYQNKKQLTLYRLSDEYSRFYLKFIENNKNGGDGTWQKLYRTQSYLSWSGFAFETLCLKHIQQIKKALRIDAIYTTSSSWFNENAQVDMLIDRSDNVMHLCEMKFCNSEFSIDKLYYLNLKHKIAALQQDTKTKKNIFELLFIFKHRVLTPSFSEYLRLFFLKQLQQTNQWLTSTYAVFLPALIVTWSAMDFC